ncbi:MAG: pyridoxamine 5'-phosphate oxidase family protein [Stenomitos rutilans HA7619-LM2]|jgi:general stress protein 26|nr:pyridoxamine 5'-phosphate oxidase family protein [Stenomitos rutilans HA7619-LM2]
MTAQAPQQTDSFQKLKALVKSIDIAMLTTLDESGGLHSRPMSCNGEIDDDGTLWFFTSSQSPKVDEIDRRQQVNVSFADPHKQQYVSLSGTAQLVQDRQQIQQRWQPKLQAWFPNGLEEPNIALLKVTVEKAEYWDAPSGFVAHTLGLLKAVTTGKPAEGGENKKMSL